MNQQGCNIIDLNFFASISASVSACGSFDELQALTTQSLNSIGATTQAINAQVALMAPIAALLSGITTPGAAVTWINDFIAAFLTPLVVPSVTMAAQLPLLAAQVATLQAAITAKALSFGSATISFPPYPLTTCV